MAHYIMMFTFCMNEVDVCFTYVGGAFSLDAKIPMRIFNSPSILYMHIYLFPINVAQRWTKHFRSVVCYRVFAVQKTSVQMSSLDINERIERCLYMGDSPEKSFFSAWLFFYLKFV